MSPELLLLPGLNNTPAVFEEVGARLPAALRPRAVDLPALETVEALADHVLAEAPPQFWLAGFSFGGYVSLAILERAPHRVRGLALVCSLPGADGPAQRERRQASIDKALSGSYEVDTARNFTPFHPDSLQRPDLLDRRAAVIRDYGAARYVAHSRACMRRPDRTALLKGALPRLLVTASHDVVVPVDAVRELARALSAEHPSIDLACIEGAGHLLPLEQPAALADTLRDWVQRQEG